MPQPPNASPLYHAPSTPTVADLLAQATGERQLGRHSMADVLCTSAVTRDTTGEAHLYWAEYLVGEGRLDEASYFLDRARVMACVNRDLPLESRCLQLMARSARLQNRTDEARRLLQCAISRWLQTGASLTPRMMLDRAFELFESGLTAEAESLCTAVCGSERQNVSWAEITDAQSLLTAIRAGQGHHLDAARLLINVIRFRLQSDRLDESSRDLNWMGEILTSGGLDHLAATAFKVAERCRVAARWRLSARPISVEKREVVSTTTFRWN